MKLIELPFGDELAYKEAWAQIELVFSKESYKAQAAIMTRLGSQIKKIYMEIDPYFQIITKEKCSHCPNPCCVNRHGFPDFEDLLTRKAMKLGPLKYNFSVVDTEKCQFLSKKGCILPRIERSYRCSWYFCEDAEDLYEIKRKKLFKPFRRGFSKIGRKRAELIEIFEKI